MRIPMTYLLSNWRWDIKSKKKKNRNARRIQRLRLLGRRLTPSTSRRGPRCLPACLFTRQRRNLMTPRGCRYDRSDPLHPSRLSGKKQKHPRPSSVSGTEAATKALSTQSVFVSRIDSSAARGVFTRANSRLLSRKASVKRL